jgi:orotidine-5'-phosphate decarboxylase
MRRVSYRPGKAMNAIDRRDRLIVALDVPTSSEARALAERLGNTVSFYKIGLELFTTGGYFELLAWLRGAGHRVFADLKLYDIPETVRRAVANLRGCGATFLTVHGDRAILEAAAKEKGAMQVLAVTVLTSLGPADLKAMGYAGDVQQLVLARARDALEAGCDGVIASGLEAPMLKAEFGDRLLVVTPGIRPAAARGADDQKRTVDVAQAFGNGADYIVVGRPVRDAPDPRAAARAIQDTIASLFSA